MEFSVIEETGTDRTLNSVHLFCADAWDTEMPVTMGLCQGDTETGLGPVMQTHRRWTVGISGSPSDAGRQEKSQEKIAKKDMHLSEATGQNLECTVHNKNESKKKQRSPKVPGRHSAHAVFNRRDRASAGKTGS